MSLALLDWRRRVARLYAEIRAEPDAAAAHDHWRRTRDELLRTHPVSPIPEPQRAGYPGAPVAAYDPSLRFEVAVDTDVPRTHMGVATGTDGIAGFDRIGRAHVPGGGDLDVWWLAGYGGGVFIPVKDATAGSATYGGGRYLLDTVKGADLGGDDGRLILDLNFAYNPSCAYDPAWACPLAPRAILSLGHSWQASSCPGQRARPGDPPAATRPARPRQRHRDFVGTAVCP